MVLTFVRQNNIEDSNLSLVNLCNTKTLIFYGFLLLLLLCIIHIYIMFVEPRSWIAWLSAIIYFIFVILTYQKTPIFFWLFFLFYFGQGTAIISCAYLESGNYITEQATYAYATGATLRLVIYDMIFFLSGLAIFTFIKINISINTECIQTALVKNKRYLFLVMLLLLTTLYIGLYAYGAPLFMGMDRFSYWSDHPLPILRTIGGQVYFMVFLLGIMYSAKKDKKIIILFLGVCVYLIFNSEKFSGLYSILYYFLLPIIINGLVQGKRQFSLKRIGIYTVAISSLFLMIIYYHYSNINISASDSAADILVNRALGLQGHVWWGTDVEVMQREEIINFDQLSKELSSFMSYNSENEDVGMRYLISLVAPPSIAKIYLENGINFTMGYPAIGLYIFNYIGLIFLQIFVAGVVVLAVVYLFNKLTRFQLIRAAVAVKIFIEIYASFTIGNFYQLFSLKVFMYIIIAVVIEGIVLLGKKNLFIKKHQIYDTEI